MKTSANLKTVIVCSAIVATLAACAQRSRKSKPRSTNVIRDIATGPFQPTLAIADKLSDARMVPQRASSASGRTGGRSANLKKATGMRATCIFREDLDCEIKNPQCQGQAAHGDQRKGEELAEIMSV